MTEEKMPLYIGAGKRLAVEESEWLGDWYVSASPRNGNSNAEGQWCQWVHLARLILAHPLTAEHIPSLAVEYPDAPDLYSEAHPGCLHCAKGASADA